MMWDTDHISPLFTNDILRFHAGAPTDYDEWAKICGQDDWSEKEFRKCVQFSDPAAGGANNWFRYLLKFEKYSPDSKYSEVDVKLRVCSWYN